MSLGSNLSRFRKKSGFSQEMIAEKLGVSRQTVSKWELDTILPNIEQVKKLASLYEVDLATLVDDDDEIMNEIKAVMGNTTEKNVEQVNWTKVWSKKYPILGTYSEVVDVEKYGKEIRRMFEEIEHTYHYSKLDSMLVLKDILAQEWKKYKQFLILWYSYFR